MYRNVLALQFEDSVFTINLDDSKKWTIWTNRNEMIKLHLIRGSKNKIYYAEKGESGDKIFMLSNDGGYLEKT